MAGTEHRILLLGASGMLFTDTGPSGTLPALLAAELTRRKPGIAWFCDAVEIPPARNMPDRVTAALDAHHPDVVVLSASSSYFTYEYVSATVRRRWPKLFSLVSDVSTGLREASGGGFEGGRSARGWLFRAPRWLGRRLIGAEPFMKVENAIENTRASIDVVTARGGIVTIFKQPTMSDDLPSGTAERSGARLRRFRRAIEETCGHHGIPCYDLREAMAVEGKSDGRVSDGLHSDIETRTWDAQHLAKLVLKLLPD